MFHPNRFCPPLPSTPTHILPPGWPDLNAKFGYGRFVDFDPIVDKTGCTCGANLLIAGKNFRTIEQNCFDHAHRIVTLRDGRVISDQKTGPRTSGVATGK